MVWLLLMILRTQRKYVQVKKVSLYEYLFLFDTSPSKTQILHLVQPVQPFPSQPGPGSLPNVSL